MERHSIKKRKVTTVSKIMSLFASLLNSSSQSTHREMYNFFFQENITFQTIISLFFPLPSPLSLFFDLSAKDKVSFAIL